MMDDEIEEKPYGSRPGPLVPRNRSVATRFKKGNGGGPGRPKGSKNKATLVRESMQDKTTLMLGRMAPHLFKKAMEMAMEGDAAIMKEMISRINPKVVKDEEKDSKVEVTINNFTGSEPAKPEVVIDGTTLEITNG